ncbi:MAG: phosphatase PAP2 family protein [Oscillospiraceae bacterium]
MQFIQSFDTNALIYIQDFLRTPILTAILVFFSRIGDFGLVWIFVGLILLIPDKTRRGGFDVLICLLAAYVVNDLVLKLLFERVRPYEVISGLKVLVPSESSYSFPSGHANSSFASALALTLAFGRKGALAYIPAVLIAGSRCYVGVHYPSDVLAGMIVGTTVAPAIYLLLRRYVKADFLRKKQL